MLISIQGTSYIVNSDFKEKAIKFIKGNDRLSTIFNLLGELDTMEGQAFIKAYYTRFDEEVIDNMAHMEFSSPQVRDLIESKVNKGVIEYTPIERAGEELYSEIQVKLGELEVHEYIPYSYQDLDVLEMVEYLAYHDDYSENADESWRNEWVELVSSNAKEVIKETDYPFTDSNYMLTMEDGLLKFNDEKTKDELIMEFIDSELSALDKRGLQNLFRRANAQKKFLDNSKDDFKLADEMSYVADILHLDAAEHEFSKAEYDLLQAHYDDLKAREETRNAHYKTSLNNHRIGVSSALNDITKKNLHYQHWISIASEGLVGNDVLISAVHEFYTKELNDFIFERSTPVRKMAVNKIELN